MLVCSLKGKKKKKFAFHSELFLRKLNIYSGIQTTGSLLTQSFAKKRQKTLVKPMTADIFGLQNI